LGSKKEVSAPPDPFKPAGGGLRGFVYIPAWLETYVTNTTSSGGDDPFFDVELEAGLRQCLSEIRRRQRETFNHESRAPYSHASTKKSCKYGVNLTFFDELFLLDRWHH